MKQCKFIGAKLNKMILRIVDLLEYLMLLIKLDLKYLLLENKLFLGEAKKIG